MLFKKNKDKEILETFNEYLYSDEEREEIETFTKRIFGFYDLVYKEKEFDDIRLDIDIVLPNANEPFYKLITNGLGPYGKCELVMFVNKTFNITSKEECYAWVIKYLKILGRLPVKYDVNLSDGYIVTNNKPVCEASPYTSFLFVEMKRDFEPLTCHMKSGRDVKFYQVFPLYKDEAEMARSAYEDFLTAALVDNKKLIIDNNRDEIKLLNNESN